MGIPHRLLHSSPHLLLKHRMAFSLLSKGLWLPHSTCGNAEACVCRVEFREGSKAGKSRVNFCFVWASFAQSRQIQRKWHWAVLGWRNSCLRCQIILSENRVQATPFGNCEDSQLEPGLAWSLLGGPDKPLNQCWAGFFFFFYQRWKR